MHRLVRRFCAIKFNEGRQALNSALALEAGSSLLMVGKMKHEIGNARFSYGADAFVNRQAHEVVSSHQLYLDIDKFDHEDIVGLAQATRSFHSRSELLAFNICSQLLKRLERGDISLALFLRSVVCLRTNSPIRDLIKKALLNIEKVDELPLVEKLIFAVN